MSITRQLMAIGSLAAIMFSMGCGGGGGGSDEIIRVSRQNNSGTYAYFRETVLGEDREFKLGSNDMSGSKDVVELVANTPNAIGYSGMGYATDDVKMLSLSREPGGEAIAPTVENAASGAYPLARALYLYTVGDPNPTLKHYLDWIASAEGQDIVAEVGYVPVEAKEMPDDTPPPPGSIKVSGSDTMLQVAQRWSEVYMQKYPDVNIQVSGGGSGTGIKALIDGTVDIANASRDMKDEERATIAEKGLGELHERTVGLDALAVYVHKDNPLNEISLDDLAEIYGEGGKITNWSQLGSGEGSGN